MRWEEGPRDTSNKPMRTPGEILEVALALEKEAHAFYNNALKTAGNPQVRELLEHPADAEYKHARLVEKKMAELLKG